MPPEGEVESVSSKHSQTGYNKVNNQVYQGEKQNSSDLRGPVIVSSGTGSPDSLQSDSNDKNQNHRKEKRSSRRKGDWNCGECGFMNFGRYAQCKKCHTSRGDWMCRCGAFNFASRQLCVACSEDKSVGKSKEAAFWVCQSCKNENYGDRGSCKKCGDARTILSVPDATIKQVVYHANKNNVIAMQELFNKLKSRITDVPLWNVVLSAYNREGMHVQIMDVYREMLARDISPNSLTFSLVISSLYRKRDYKSIIAAFNLMLKLGVKPDKSTLIMLMAISSKQNQPGHIRRLVQMFEDLGYQHNEYSRNICLRVRVGAIDYPEGIISLYEEIFKSRGFSGDLATFSIMLSVFLRHSEDYNRLLDYVIKELELLELQPNVKIITSMLRIHSDLGCLDQMVFCYNKMVSQGLHPDAVLYSEMWKAFKAAGKVSEIPFLLREMRKHRVVPLPEMYIELLRWVAREYPNGETPHVTDVYELSFGRRGARLSREQFELLLAVFGPEDTLMGHREDELHALQRFSRNSDVSLRTRTRLARPIFFGCFGAHTCMQGIKE